jgi:predicted choloylglycine hydrolase
MTMLTQLNLSGSHFDIGAALGRFGQKAFYAYRQQSDVWQSLQAFKDQAHFQSMGRAIAQQHPDYWDELKGLAHGLGISEQEALLWHCRGDLATHTRDGCTTIQLPGKSSIIAHNEDGDPAFHGACAIAQIAVHGRGVFVSFVYPGSLPGHTFAVTEKGLAFTVNNLRGNNPGRGLPRMLAVRALLDQSTVSEALSYLKTGSFAGGFHLTLAQAGCQGLYSIEFHANHCSVVEIKAPSAHANHMIHLPMQALAQHVTASSQSRQTMARDLIAQSESVDALSILWHDQGEINPIFRTSANDSDQENTLATAQFLVGDQQVDWAIYDGRNTQPAFRLKNHEWSD